MKKTLRYPTENHENEIVLKTCCVEIYASKTIEQTCLRKKFRTITTLSIVNYTELNNSLNLKLSFIR